jgi:hypothetical protein
MNGPAPIGPKSYTGLKPLEASTFPKTCICCRRTYATFEGFLENTLPVRGTTGLSSEEIGSDSTVVLLFRDCPCHSTLLVLCEDRRAATSPKFREAFHNLFEELCQEGMEEDAARLEAVRRLKQSGY